MLWLLNHTEEFPKSERFRMARRLEESMFAFHDDPHGPRVHEHTVRNLRTDPTHTADLRVVAPVAQVAPVLRCHPFDLLVPVGWDVAPRAEFAR